jgi:purine-binding chemotaxis protein CheW
MSPRDHATRGPVDWAGIRQRIDAAGRALAGATELSPERVRETLQERARALARPLKQSVPDDTFDLITFALADEVYAVEARHVSAVFKLIDLSLLPGARPPVCGVTAWRGELLLILDLRASLGLPVSTLNDLSRVIVLGKARPTFGILVDAAREMVTLQAAAVREPPDGIGVEQGLLRGITSDAVLVLDAERMLRTYA